MPRTWLHTLLACPSDSEEITLRNHRIYGTMLGIFLSPKVVWISQRNRFFPELFPDLDLSFYSLSQRVWWFILYVQTFGHTGFWVCLWGCFWRNWQPAWSRLATLPTPACRPLWVASSNQLKVHMEQKGWPSHESFLPDWVFSCLLTWTEMSALPGTWACWPLDWNYTIGSPGSPPCWLLAWDLSASIIVWVSSRECPPYNRESDDVCFGSLTPSLPSPPAES